MAMTHLKIYSTKVISIFPLHITSSIQLLPPCSYFKFYIQIAARFLRGPRGIPKKKTAVSIVFFSMQQLSHFQLPTILSSFVPVHAKGREVINNM